MRAVLMVGLLVVSVACGSGGGADVPSCQQAVSSYYEAGCAFFDLQTGAELPAGDIIAACRSDLASAPASCDDDFDEFLFCIDDPPASCDCSAEQEALLTCQ